MKSLLLCLFIFSYGFAVAQPEIEVTDTSLKRRSMENKKLNTLLIKSDITIAGKSGGPITKEEILSSKGLELDSSSARKCQISSFKMVLINHQTGQIKEVAVFGPALTKEAREKIKKAPSGSKLYFEYIKCKANNFTGSMPPLSFVLK